MKIVSWIILIYSAFCISACGKQEHMHRPVCMEDFSSWSTEEYSLYSHKIRSEIEILSRQKSATFYSDVYLNRYYREGNPFLWIDRNGADSRADSMIAVCSEPAWWGMPSGLFPVAQMRHDLHCIRHLDFSSDDINKVFARLEYNLTKSYLRLWSGLRFGLLQPAKIFNRLEKLSSESSGREKYTMLYDIPVQAVSQKDIDQALKNLSSMAYLDSLYASQPRNPDYQALLRLYRRGAVEIYPESKILVNLERMRWRYPRPSDYYVWGNLASQTLDAFSSGRDTALSMRIAVGSPKNKTPLMMSRIDYMQVDPYWIIPYSIIKNEIVKLHLKDTAYFRRNQIKIIHKESGKELKPEYAEASMLLSGAYMLRQEKGKSNSLGRLIFRFRNNFSIYLHDTNSKYVFSRENRAVSHGCIRLQHPLLLADFLMNNEKESERLRQTLSASESKDGQEVQALPASFRRMKTYYFTPPCPLFLDYYTLYFDKQGKLRSCADPYGYDKVLYKHLNKY